MATVSPNTGPGFDWSAPPTSADAAIDAALDAVPHPGGAPFSGFPLSATLPTPPLVDDRDVPPMAPPIAMPGGVPAVAPAAPTPDEPVDKSAAKAAAKLEAARKRERIRDAKARAKEARAQRKRGDTP